MSFRLTACGVAGCDRIHGVIHEARTARKAPDDFAGAGALRSGDIGSPPGAQSSKPVGASASESRKALSTTG